MKKKEEWVSVDDMLSVDDLVDESFLETNIVFSRNLLASSIITANTNDYEKVQEFNFMVANIPADRNVSKTNSKEESMYGYTDEDYDYIDEDDGYYKSIELPEDFMRMYMKEYNKLVYKYNNMTERVKQMTERLRTLTASSNKMRKEISAIDIDNLNIIADVAIRSYKLGFIDGESSTYDYE